MNAQSKIRELREAKGWSNAQFVRELDAAGLSMYQTSLARIERGTQHLKLTEAAIVADVLGVDVYDLLPSGRSVKEIRLSQLRSQRDLIDEEIRKLEQS
jgi:transcriptional regulator with XRE-family HTH domain